MIILEYNQILENHLYVDYYLMCICNSLFMNLKGRVGKFLANLKIIQHKNIYEKKLFQRVISGLFHLKSSYSAFFGKLKKNSKKKNILPIPL